MQHYIYSGTTLKIWAMEPTNMTNQFWIFLETFSQRIILKIANFCMFPEMHRKTKKLYIDHTT